MNPENEEIEMLFREFNIIAAVAYAAQCAAEGETGLKWHELGEDDQSGFMQQVLAIARGEANVAGDVFEATAKAILEYNGGQGGLALEEMANIARAPIELELVTEDDVADRPIREVVSELLNELAERRQTGTACGTGPAYNDRDLRTTALGVAVEQTKRARDARVEYEPEVVEAAAHFYEFLTKGEEPAWVRTNALHAATSVLDPGLRPNTVTLVADDFMTFLEPPQPEADAAPEVVTVQ